MKTRATAEEEYFSHARTTALDFIRLFNTFELVSAKYN